MQIAWTREVGVLGVLQRLLKPDNIKSIHFFSPFLTGNMCSTQVFVVGKRIFLVLSTDTGFSMPIRLLVANETDNQCAFTVKIKILNVTNSNVKLSLNALSN